MSLECCSITFENERKLIDHKVKASEHNYCKLCNADFEDDEKLSLHKVLSSLHINCPVCFLDFKTLGGRDRHLRQLHKQDQEIACPGCQIKFPRAGALVFHLEKGKCKEVAPDEFFADIEYKAVVNHYLSGDVEGSYSQTQEWANKTAVAHDGPLPPEKMKPLIADRNEFPELGKDLLEALPDSPRLIDIDPDDTVHPLDSASQVGGPMARKKYIDAFYNENWDQNVPARSRAIDTEREKLMTAVQDVITDEEGVMHWDRYWNSTVNRYICPLPICRRGFEQLGQLHNHLRFESHTSQTYQCPSCLKKFKSLTAIIQHAESESHRCKIRHSDNFGDFISLATGNYVALKGKDEDGKPIFESGSPLPRTGTTI